MRFALEIVTKMPDMEYSVIKSLVHYSCNYVLEIDTIVLHQSIEIDF